MHQQTLAHEGPWRGAVEGLAPLLPEQMLGAPQRSPEQRLMAAVLEDAMRELARPGGEWFGARARRRAEIRAWFASDDVAWPFSFVNVCEALDLDVTRFRTRLDGGRIGRSRGAVRR
jgi:hypothetical protein